MTATSSMSGLFALIERATPEGGEWCSIAKSTQLAALILALRPRVIVEIGVFLGGSLIPMALAQQTYALPAREVCWAVDPWSTEASIEDMSTTNADWWGRCIDHGDVARRFAERVARYGLSDVVRIAQCRSGEFDPHEPIDLCHIDGNHGPQATRDVERFAPLIRHGGILVLDDLEWEGGHVRAGFELAKSLGFAEMYPLGTGVVMRRA